MKQTERYHEPISQSFLQFVKKRGLIRTGQHVIAAVSGGIDSMVLLDLLAKHKDQLKISISVAHVNHMPRGKESKGDEKLVVIMIFKLKRMKKLIVFTPEAADPKVVAKLVAAKRPSI